jgi:hypothetical protein
LTRLYENKGHWWRQTLSLVAVILVSFYGVWELWWATFGTGDYHSPMGEMFGIGDDRYLFGIAFLFGGIYACWTLIRDSADVVSTFDLDEPTGMTLATLWRPGWTEKLVAPLSAIDNWRLYVKVGNRNVRTFYIYADHPNYRRPLNFDLRRANLEGLRRVAPEAVADFEAAAGVPAGTAADDPPPASDGKKKKKRTQSQPQ